MYRPPRKSDLTAITEIYNDAILTTIGTFDTELKTEEEQKIWFEAHSSRYPILVAESEGAVTGWSSLSKWSDRAVYRETAELPLYVKREFRGKGIGGKLVLAIINEGKPAGLHTIIARIAVGNPASIRLAESVGYCRIGVMK